MSQPNHQTMPQPNRHIMPQPYHAQIMAPPPPRHPPRARASVEERERWRRDQVRSEITQLEAKRHAIVAALQSLGAARKQTLEDLERALCGYLEVRDELRDGIEQIDKWRKEYQRLWDQFGEGIEEKHAELFFGVSGD